MLAWLLAAPSSATAQHNATVIQSDPGRIRCYSAATGDGLARRQAIRLCRGATSDAPAQCAEAAIDQIGLSDELAIRLCRVADSTTPVTCARRLVGIGLEHREAVGYCRAFPWPLVAPRSAGSQECVRKALDRTRLTYLEAMRLCRGSRSIAPVECFEAGDDATPLGDREIVELCAPVKVSAPIAVPPTRRPPRR